ncbi:MAG: FGGY-family carbohydrate kinase [Casimicrobiaceae bacterium]
MAAVRKVVLCADLGTGSLRVGAVTATGAVVATSATALRAIEPEPGWSVIDPEVWWRALVRTVGRVLDQLPRGVRVEGLCLCGVTRTQVAVDRAGRPLAPALLFRDQRAVEEAREVARHFPVADPADAITAFHPLARIAWFARRQPELFERIGAVLEPKDFLNFRLTGLIAADSVTYSRFDALRAAPAALPDWLARCRSLLAPQRIAPWQLLGPITQQQAPFGRLQGIPVFAGAMDAWAAAVGAGAIRAGQGYDIAGTSEVAGMITHARAVAPGLVSLSWGEDVHQIGGPTQAGADCAAWCHQNFRVRGALAAAVERVGKRLPAADLPLFLPYLAGERAPLWRPDVRGAFEGMSRGHDADDFLWSVLEGVALAMRDILVSAVAGSREDLSEVRVTGGGARSGAWCQIKADVMNVPMVRTTQRETGVTGAAMAAAVGLGWHPTLAAAATAMCPIDREFEPRPARVPFHARRAERYARARQHALAQADAAAPAPRARPAHARVARIPA